MPEKKLRLNDPNRPKFDPTVLTEEQSSFRKVQEDGTAAMGQPQAQPTAFPTAPPGVTGQMPMPTGVAITPASLTPMEKQALEKLGWKEGDAIPGNLPQLLQEVQNQNLRQATDLAHMPPPGDPSEVPPLQMPEMQSLEDLQPQDQQRIRMALDQAKIDAARAPDSFEPAGPGVQDAAAGVVHRSVNIGSTPVIDDRQSPTYANGEPKRPDAANDPPPPPQPAPQPARPATAAKPQPAKCPHCEWDLSMPDEVVPTDDDKRSFAQAILGGIRWKKDYSLLNGQLLLVVRQLAPAEVDACYSQTFHDQKNGRIENRLDFWETINRYRMMLQLVQFRSGENLVTLPEAIEEWGQGSSPAEPTALRDISATVNEQVLTSEALHRIVRSTIAEFNRLSAKLEVMVTRSDFWEATGRST
jgi:hypothetical protein